MPSGFIASFPRLMIFTSGALFGGLGVWAFRPGAEGTGREGAPRTVVVPASKLPTSGAEANLEAGQAAGGVATVPAKDPTAALAQITDALRSRDPIQRFGKFSAVLGLMDASNGKMYLDAWLLFLKTDQVVLAHSEMMNRRLGQTIGETVVANRTGTPYEMSGTRTWLRDQFLGWMETDPSAGWKWLDGLKNEEFREIMAGVYLESAVLENPAQAVAVLNTVPPELQAEYGSQIVRTLRSTQPAGQVSEWITNQANSSEENRRAPWLKAGTDALMESVSNTRFPGANVARMFVQHLGQPGLDHRGWGGRAAKQYANAEPEAGLTWAATMAARPEFAGDLSIIGMAVEGIPPEKLVETAKGNFLLENGPARDTALSYLALRLNSIDADAATAAAALIHNPQLRPDLPDPKSTSVRSSVP